MATGQEFHRIALWAAAGVTRESGVTREGSRVWAYDCYVPPDPLFQGLFPGPAPRSGQGKKEFISIGAGQGGPRKLSFFILLPHPRH